MRCWASNASSSIACSLHSAGESSRVALDRAIRWCSIWSSCSAAADSTSPTKREATMSRHDGPASVPQLTARMEWLGILFGVELADRIRTLSALVDQVEQGVGTQAQAERVVALGAIARDLHSLKGAAQADGASSIEQVAHAAEGAVLALR